MWWSWWGMAWFWWLLWVVAIITFAVLLVLVPRPRMHDLDDPLRILARRYAAGELTHEEYEARRARLERDLRGETTTPSPPADRTTPQPT